MKICQTIPETISFLAEIRNKGLSVGFVPTMGALHEGHLSLIRKAKFENDYVVASIFVNPIQFNNKNDLNNYPQEIESDLGKLKAKQCDLLFNPSVSEMYPEPDQTQFDFGSLTEVMEGKFRPGHFNGVAVVVKKLFEIVTPNKAYFGLKDFQQLAVIKKLVDDYKMPIEIIPCQTLRDPDGLAMSSRNKLLTSSERELAPFIYQLLLEVKKKSKQYSIDEVLEFVTFRFSENEELELEYFDIVDMYTLQPIKNWNESKSVIACIAVYLGKVRLIDNIVLIS